MTIISAEVILGSRHAQTGKVLWTLKCRYPWIIHSEGQTHRVLRIGEDMDVMVKTPTLMEDPLLSKNAGSTRAIPFKKMVQSVLDDPFVPLKWYYNQAGMQGVEEMSDEHREEAIGIWLKIMEFSIAQAEYLDKIGGRGTHKQNVNRLLAPFSHITVVVSGTEWDNFFALRNHDAAEPHIRILAQQIRLAMTTYEQDGRIQVLNPGEWHRPFIQKEDIERIPGWEKIWTNVYTAILAGERPDWQDVPAILSKLSGARCASTSYKTVEGHDMTMDRAVPLFDKLSTNVPIHASPLEHVAMADRFFDDDPYAVSYWEYAEDHRNFRGFRQLRALVENGEFR